jgi:formate C-acetyltransferase
MSQAYLDKAIDVIRGGTGQPQLMNANVAIQRSLVRFASRGVTLDEARTSPVIFGCVGTGMAGKGSYVTFEGQPNLPKIVELTLNDGYDPHIKKQLFPPVGKPETFATFEDLYQAYLKHMAHGFLVQRRISDLGNMTREEVVPSIFRSCVIDGCLEKGLYEEQGGPLYAQSLCITTGGMDAANSLYAIKHLVYDTKQLTWAQLLDALKVNFEGHEDIRTMCYEAPKHGNDYPEVDAFVRRMMRDIEKIYRDSGTDFFDYEAHMDPFSLSFHNYFAPMTGALPNGRKKGVALTDASVSAMPGTDVEGVTALLKSAAQAIDTTRNNCNHLNVKFLPSALEGPAGARNLLTLVKTYFDLGGSHVQFNCVSSDTLREAQAHPENYKDLVVRVAGFSAYFTRLDKGVQNEIIKRTQYAATM